MSEQETAMVKVFTRSEVEGGALALPRHPTELIHNEWPMYLEKLRNLPEGRRRSNYIKTRPGKGGGTTSYTGWTNTADFFDMVYGPGQWYVEVLNIHEEVKQSNKNPTELMSEYMVHGRFRAPDTAPWDLFGHGFMYHKDDGASRSDAIESALSRCVSKAGARLSELLRSVWGKDDTMMALIQGATVTQVNGTTMAIQAIMNMAETIEEKDRAKVKIIGTLAKYGLGNWEKESLSGLTGAEITQVNKEIAELL